MCLAGVVGVETDSQDVNHEKSEQQLQAEAQTKKDARESQEDGVCINLLRYQLYRL